MFLHTELGMIDILCKQDVDVGTFSIGDPHLFSIQDIVRSIIAQFRFAAQGCSVSTCASLGKRICSDLFAREPRQILTLLFFVPV